MVEKPSPLITKAREKFLFVKEFLMMTKNINWFFDLKMALLTIYELGIAIPKTKK